MGKYHQFQVLALTRSALSAGENDYAAHKQTVNPDR